MRRFVRSLLFRALRALKLKPNLEQENKYLKEALDQVVTQSLDDIARRDAMSRLSELVEARRMAGSGPWRTSQAVLNETDNLLNLAASNVYQGSGSLGLRETVPTTGAAGDIDLMLSTWEWRREVNLSWLEFSRWGIQQIILISRLYFMKNPLIQRGVNVAAQYVFGRGVEVSSPDEKANEVLREFFERNARVLGQVALTDLERQKYYDGNLFFVFFPDKTNTGKTSIRTIDATEIQEIVCDPEDADSPWFYKRVWTEQKFNNTSGIVETKTRSIWYPALNYEPTAKPITLGSDEIQWDHPVHHRKCGSVAKWRFGCPLIYAALDWARASVNFLEACATVKKSLAQISMVLTTKGGQQALQGIKSQLQTTVGTGQPGSAWDTNPAAVDASVFASGPGTKLEAFNTKGGGGDPEEVRQFKLMVCMVFGLPETFFSDVQTGNLATATSLDRPTELNFLEKQEAWREDLIIIAKYVLRVSSGAASGILRESRTGLHLEKVVIREAGRHWVGGERGRWVMKAAAVKQPSVIEVVVNFPAIVEGDVPALMAATVAAIETGKIDDNVGAKQMYALLPDVKDGNTIADEQYPGTVTERQKKKEDAAASLAALPPKGSPVKPAEAVRLARSLIEAVIVEHPANAEHVHAGR